MFTLEDLKASGSLPGVYQEVSFSRGTVTSDRIATDVTSKELQEGGFAVIVPHANWAATVKKIPVMEAKTVYSANADGMIGCWKQKEFTFYEMELKNNQLQTVNIIKVADVVGQKNKEDINMAETSMEQLQKELEGFNAEAESNAKEITAFDGAGGTSGSSDGKSKKTDEKLNAIRGKIGDGSIVNRDGFIIQNRKMGRALGFITKTDAAVKVSLKKTAKLDAQGQKIPLPSLSEERLKSFQAGGKLKLSEVITENALTFVHAKPSKPVAMIIETPKSSDISLTKVNSASGVLDLNENADNTTQVHIISMEAAYSYLAFNYNGEIKESEKILGPRATTLVQSIRPTKAKTDATGKDSLGIQSSITLRKTENRKTLLTEGNYFPLKTFDTISTQDLSADDAAILNLNIEAAMKSKKVSDLTESSQNAITALPDNSGYTSTWFNDGTPIAVNRFDNPNEQIADVRIPRREKNLTKDGQKYTYKFVYNKLDDVEHGPLANNVYKQIINLTGMSVEEFVQAVEGFGRANRSSGGGKDYLTPDEYLRAKMSRTISVDGAKSFLELQKELENIA